MYENSPPPCLVHSGEVQVVFRIVETVRLENSTGEENSYVTSETEVSSQTRWRVKHDTSPDSRRSTRCPPHEDRLKSLYRTCVVPATWTPGKTHGRGTEKTGETENGGASLLSLFHTLGGYQVVPGRVWLNLSHYVIARIHRGFRSSPEE